MNPALVLNRLAIDLWQQVPLGVRIAYILDPFTDNTKTASSFTPSGHWLERNRLLLAGSSPILEEIFRRGKIAVNANELNRMFWAVAKQIKAEDKVPKDFNFGKLALPSIRKGLGKYRNFGIEEDDIVMFIMEKLLHQKGRGGGRGKRWDIEIEEAKKKGHDAERYFRVKLKSWIADYSHFVRVQGLSAVPRDVAPDKAIEKSPGKEDAGGFDFSMVREPIDMNSVAEARDLFRKIYKELNDPVFQQVWKFIVDNNVTDVMKPTGGTGKMLQKALSEASGKDVSPARTSQIMKGKFIPALLEAAKRVGRKEKLPKLDSGIKQMVASRLAMIAEMRNIADQV